jgi:hypothetical protein
VEVIDTTGTVSRYLCEVEQALFLDNIVLPHGAAKELLGQCLERTSAFVIGVATHGGDAWGDRSGRWRTTKCWVDRVNRRRDGGHLGQWWDLGTLEHWAAE